MKISLLKIKKIAKISTIVLLILMIFPVLVLAGWYGHKYSIYRKSKFLIRSGKVKRYEHYEKKVDLL